MSEYKSENIDIDMDKINNNNSNDKLSMTGKFIDDNNDMDVNNNNLDVNNNKIDITNYMDKNTTYIESKEKPIISKEEKIENNNIITTITTKTRKMYTPDKKSKNEEHIINKKVQKNQSDLIKEYTKYKLLQNKNNKYKNDSRSTDEEKKYNNKNISQKSSLERKIYDKMAFNNNFKNKINYIEIENDSLKTPNQFKKTYNQYINNYYNNSNMNNNYYNNTNLKTASYYKKKKYTPYPYYPYEFTVNYKDINNPSRKINYDNNENLEKKYIRGPEGNLIETFVKKTKYKDGSVLLEYV